METSKDKQQEEEQAYAWHMHYFETTLDVVCRKVTPRASTSYKDGMKIDFVKRKASSRTAG